MKTPVVMHIVSLDTAQKPHNSSARLVLLSSLSEVYGISKNADLVTVSDLHSLRLLCY